MMRLTNGSLGLALFSSLWFWPTQINAQELASGYSVDRAEPSISRNDGIEAKIDHENIELSTYAGALSLVDFGVNATYGIRADYHLTEDFFFEFSYGVSKASETSFETLNSLSLLSDDERNLSMMTASLGWHFMPGETFLTSSWTLTSQLYGMIGLGKVNFAGQSDTLVNLGLGYRALLSDWMALRFDFKDHIFAVDVLGEDKRTHNFEVIAGLSVFF